MAMRESWLVSGGVPSNQATISSGHGILLANYYAIVATKIFISKEKSSKNHPSPYFFSVKDE